MTKRHVPPIVSLRALAPSGGASEWSFLIDQETHQLNHLQAVLTFHPNQANPARAGGRGVWRVYWCGYVVRNPGLKLIRTVPSTPTYRTLVLPARRVYKKGSRVDPRKVLGV